MSDPKEVRADKAGFKRVMKAGVTGDRLVILTFLGVRNTFMDLMAAVPSTDVSSEARLQVMALVTALENATACLTYAAKEGDDDDDIPEGVQIGLDVLLETLAEIVAEEEARKRGSHGGDPEE